MSKEIAKKLIAELETNEELKAKVASVTDPEELLKIAKGSGYDVTIEELIEAEKESRKVKAAQTDEKLTLDDLEAVAGGLGHEDAPDGHEMGCEYCWYSHVQCNQKGYYCSSDNFYEGEPCRGADVR
ncbi:MAG: Nif11-like leader peptide family natural product precursor [Ruminiclostridium sp.]|nr:Nif11-like leader peptide family natural product precursor [Ruminiclostridium sp.]